MRRPEPRRRRMWRGCLAGLLLLGCAHPTTTGLDHRPKRLQALLARSPAGPLERLDRGWAGFLGGCDWNAAAADLQRAARALAPEQRAPRQLAWMGAGLVSLAEARFPDALRAFIRALEADPTTPTAWVAALQLAEVAHQVRDGHAVLRERIADRLAATGDGRPGPWMARCLRRILREGARRSGDWRQARRIEARMGVPPYWRTAAPFGRHPLTAMERAFAPERAPLDSVELPRGVQLIPAWPRRGRLQLVAPEATGAGYAEAYFHLERPATLALRIAGDASWAAWIDDQPLGERPAHRARLPGTIHLGVAASAGWHRLLLKAALRDGRVGLAVELAPADGSPAGFRWWRGSDAAPRTITGGARTTALRGARATRAAALARRSTHDAVTPLLAALASWEIGDLPRTEELLALAAERAPRFALNPYLQALVWLENPDLPPGMDRTRARKLLLRATDSCPPFLLGRFRLALLEAQLGQPMRALEALAALEHQRPTSFLWPLYSGRLRDRLGWEPEARRDLRRALARMPDRPETLRHLHEMAIERHALGERLQLARRLEALGHWREGQVDLWRTREQPEKAAALLRRTLERYPGWVAARLELIDLSLSRGQLDAAAAELQRCQRSAVDPLALGLRRAELAERRGERTRALALRRQLARQHPWHLPLRRALAAESGRSQVRVLGAPRLAAQELIAAYRKAAEPPQGDAVVLLDQGSVEVAADGSSIERVHSLVQVLSPEGVERWGEVADLPPGATVERLRTIGPDGRSHEAEIIPGKSSITLPALQLGGFVEIAYVHGLRGASLANHSWLGRDFLFGLVRTPIRRSLYTVAVPAGIELTIERHNEAPAPVVREQGEHRIYTFEMRDAPAIRTEPHSPPLPELVPRVQVGFGARWRDLRDILRLELQEATRPSAAVERFARSAAGPAGATTDRVRRLFRKVCNDIRRSGTDDDFSVPAPYVLARREGNRLVLLVAALRALGHQPRVLLARTAAHARGRGSLPDEGDYSYGVLALTVAGTKGPRQLWLDPAERFNPFDVLFAHLSGMPAIEVSGTDPERVFTRLPADHGGRRQKRIELSLELTRDGTLAGSGLEAIGTAQAVRYRQALHAMDRTRRRQVLEAGLNGTFSGALLEQFEIANEADPAHPLEIRYRFRAPGWARLRRGRLELQGGFYPFQLVANLVAGAERETPLVLTDRTDTATRIAIALPPGARAEPPEPLRLSAPLSSFQMEVRQRGRRLLIEKQLRVESGRIAPADYPAFRRFCQQVDAADTAGIAIRLDEEPAG